MNCANEFGRDIVRGILQYVNLQRRWVLSKDIQGDLTPDTEWPAFEGAIFAGVPWSVFEYGLKRCPNVVHVSGGGQPELCPVVSLDDEAAGAMAAEHLISCRLERFAYYGSTSQGWVASRRLDGFRAALHAKGYSCDESPFQAPQSRERMSLSHRPVLTEWLRSLPKPVGIMAVDDSAAHDLAAACVEADIGVPDHVAIIGVNNDELLCETAWPPLSSIEADFSRAGYAAAKIMDRLLAGEELTTEERRVRLPPLGVAQRQSTNVLAVNDPNVSDAVRYIREHACDPCSVEDILRVVPVGRRWLERQFVAHMGKTPHDLISEVRIETARRLLQQKDLKISEIAARCGYSGDNSFHAVFRRLVGATPAAYRRQLFKTTP